MFVGIFLVNFVNTLIDTMIVLRMLSFILLLILFMYLKVSENLQSGRRVILYIPTLNCFG